MTHIATFKPRAASSTAQVRVPALLLAAVLICLSVQINAQESASSSRTNEAVNARQAAADLEKEFWACDHAATTRGVGLEEGAICGAVFEDVKRSKFGGDFRAMLNWWQQNKAAEHLAIAAVSRTDSVPRADEATSR